MLCLHWTELITILFLIISFSFNAKADVINDVVVNNNDRISLNTIKTYGDIKIGNDYTSDDLNNILKDLYKTNFFKEIQINIKKKQETQIFIETPYRNNKLLTDIMKIDNDSLRLCVATNLTDTNQTITSKTIKQWHQNKIPDLSKKLCIFLLN